MLHVPLCVLQAYLVFLLFLGGGKQTHHSLPTKQTPLPPPRQAQETILPLTKKKQLGVVTGADHIIIVKFNMCSNVQYVMKKSSYILTQNEDALIKVVQKEEIIKNTWKEE